MTVSPRRRAVAPALAVFALVATAPLNANAIVKTNHSIAGVKLGATEKHVMARLGKPHQRGCYEDKCSTHILTFYYQRHRKPTYQVIFYKNRVVEITTYLRSQKLATGFGPGSSMKGIEKHYPHGHYGGGGAGPGEYFISGAYAKTGYYTDFEYAGPKATALAVGVWKNSYGVKACLEISCAG